MKTFRIKYESMQGDIREVKIKAATLDEATTLVCRECARVGNLLAAWQGKTRVL